MSSFFVHFIGCLSEHFWEKFLSEKCQVMRAVLHCYWRIEGFWSQWLTWLQRCHIWNLTRMTFGGNRYFCPWISLSVLECKLCRHLCNTYTCHWFYDSQFHQIWCMSGNKSICENSLFSNIFDMTSTHWPIVGSNFNGVIFKPIIQNSNMHILSQHWFSQCWLRSVSSQQLTHSGRDKMDAIFQTTFSNIYSWMKIYEYQLKFHWSLFLRLQLTIFQHWFRWWLGADQAISHYLNQWWIVYAYMRHSASMS